MTSMTQRDVSSPRNSSCLMLLLKKSLPRLEELWWKHQRLETTLLLRHLQRLMPLLWAVMGRLVQRLL